MLRHSNLVWPIWNFDPPNRPLRIVNPPILRKSKNWFFSADTWPILTYGYSKCVEWHFWPFLFFFFFFSVFTNFWEPKYCFFAIFDSRNVQKSMISNRRNGVRVSQNHENHVFEYICLDLVESSGESPPILRKMFRGHLGVENSILLNPYFGPKRNFEWKWKSTLQRLACISKLGFWQNFGGPRGGPQKKISAEPIFFFFA